MKDHLHKLFNLNVTALTPLDRLDQSHGNQLFKVQTDSGNYFLKEIPSHSKSDGLENVYRELVKCHPQSFKMVLPLKDSSGNFIFSYNEKEMMLLPYVEHTVFAEADIGLARISTLLEELFNEMKPLNIPEHPFKNYDNWFKRATSLLHQKTGDHPFYATMNLFIENRFNQLEFQIGVSHFDLNPYNIWTSQAGELLLADFDNAQRAAYAKDIFDCCARFLELDVHGATISQKALDDIFQFAQKYIPNLTQADVKFLLVRPKLGVLFDPNSKFSVKEITTQLDHLHTFLK